MACVGRSVAEKLKAAKRRSLFGSAVKNQKMKEDHGCGNNEDVLESEWWRSALDCKVQWRGLK
jgi:hypothetical protein